MWFFGACLSLCALSLAAAAPSRAADPALELLAPAAACPRQKEARASIEAKRDAMLCLVNWARARRGLRPLRASSGLELAAERKAAAILRCGLSHSPCRTPSLSFLQEAGYGSGRRWSVGENLAFASWPLSARTVFVLWLRSDEHRANVLNPSWRDIGIAELSEDGPDEQPAVWVVEFGWTRTR